LGLTLIALVLGLVISPGWPLFIVAGALLFLALYDYIPGVREFRDRMIGKLLAAAVEAKEGDA
jgi:uncharacterized BrkB/YihY/UPF0761 family membrane protein